MKFDTPAGTTPIDRQAVVGRPHPRVEGRLKTTGTATYAAEYHDVGDDLAYGYILGAAIAKGRISRLDLSIARAAPPACRRRPTPPPTRSREPGVPTSRGWPCTPSGSPAWSRTRRC